MATRDEAHSTRGRANALRTAMRGQMDQQGLTDEQVYDTLDLCLECRACKAECPVGVDMARFKAEFLAGYYERRGTPLRARVRGLIHDRSVAASAVAGLINPWLKAPWVRALNERLFGIARRRALPAWASRPLTTRWRDRPPAATVGRRVHQAA